jgi:PGF-pre-PGF domain-containing protein
MKKILFSIFFLLAIMPAMASDGTKFTVFGQVTDTDGTPINGVTVALSVSGSSISTTTANVTLVNGNNASGYYVFELANMPVNVNAGDSMTITATTTGKSASWTGPRTASEPQEVNLGLSTGDGGGGGNNGGGGGGGGTSDENFSNIQAHEAREEIIAKDLPAKYTFRTLEIPVYEILIIGNVNLGLVNTQIELLKNTSTLVNKTPAGTVYKNLNIWVGSSGIATPKNIKDAIIKFKVENSWLSSGGFKDTDIVLVKWDGTEWIKLVTQPKNSDGSFTYYEGKTNAFSPFAIVAIKGYVAPTETMPGKTAKPAKPEGTAAPASTPTGRSPTTIIVVVLGAVLIAAIYILKIRRR